MKNHTPWDAASDRVRRKGRGVVHLRQKKNFMISLVLRELRIEEERRGEGERVSVKKAP
jgi:hypothetical protein